MLIKTAAALLILALCQSGQERPLAFPGAEGAGRFAKGGRGGRVIEVTNLNDSGPGSLRSAVEADGPRIVVFRLSGTIELQSTLTITNSRITIAGQTAPGDGICLKNCGLWIAADDVIIRYIRARPGDSQGENLDAINIDSGRNIIVDHCSTSWGVDETLSACTRGQLGNVTVQWCIISESLNCSVHSKGCHGYGSLIRGAWGNQYSFHHNLYAHHRGRSPRPGNYNSREIDPKGFTLDFRNNVIYNWKGSFAGYNGDEDSITKTNFVGNYYKSGPDSTHEIAFREQCTFAKGWFADNFMSGQRPKDPWNLVRFDEFTDQQKTIYKLTSPVPVAPVETHDPADAFEIVLAEAGAILPRRDPVDARIVNEVLEGKGMIIDDESQVGGWPVLKSAPAPADTDHDGMPDDWEKAKGLDPGNPKDGPKDRNGDGYTNVEEYLNAATAGI